jgi:hypothetical protein
LRRPDPVSPARHKQDRRRPPRPDAAEQAVEALDRAGTGSTAAAPRRPDKPRVAPLPPRGRDAAPSPARPTRAASPEVVRAPLPSRPAPIEDLGTSLARAVGARRVPRARADLDAAAKAFDADRYPEALKLTRGLRNDAPDVPEVRELHGLTLYRLGRWREAIAELEAFRALAGSAEQDHVLMDCYRALRRWADVDELWDELREVSPNAEVVNEGRIVMAGSYADRGDLPGAIRLLEKGWKTPPRPRPDHLRRAYALADLYERSGQPVRARQLFRWVLGHDREFADVVDRVRALG